MLHPRINILPICSGAPSPFLTLFHKEAKTAFQEGRHNLQHSKWPTSRAVRQWNTPLTSKEVIAGSMHPQDPGDTWRERTPRASTKSLLQIIVNEFRRKLEVEEERVDKKSETLITITAAVMMFSLPPSEHGVGPPVDPPSEGKDEGPAQQPRTQSENSMASGSAGPPGFEIGQGGASKDYLTYCARENAFQFHSREPENRIRIY